MVDDIDSCINRLLKRGKLFYFRYDSNSRSSPISIMYYTSHLCYKCNETKLIFAECHSVTTFASQMDKRQLQYMLKQHFGLDSKQKKKL